MPFDVAGARAAGYSDGEIASFLGSQAGFDVDGATKAGYKPAEVIGFLSDITKDRGPVPEGDPLTRVAPSTAGSQTFTASPDQPRIGSVFDDVKMEPPTNDAAQNRRAMDKSVSPGSVMFESGRALQKVDDAIARGDARTARERAAQPEATPENIAGGLQKGLALSTIKTIQGLRMEYADATGDAATLEEAKRFTKMADQWEKESTPRFDSDIAGMLYGGTAGFVNSLPMVAAGSVNPVVGVGLFAAQAQAAGYGKYRTRGATTGEAATGGALEGAIMAGTAYLPLKFIADKIGRAGVGEFVAGLVARDVPTLVAQGIANDMVDTAVANPNKTWGDFIAEQPAHIAQSVVSAGIFAAGMGAGHATASAARRAAGYAGERFGTPSQQFGRALEQDIDRMAPGLPAGEVAGRMEGENLNPNLARVDPIAKIAAAPDVDSAIAAAKEAVSAPGSFADEMLAIRPLEQPAQPPKAADVSLPVAPDSAVPGGAGERSAVDAGSVEPGGLLDRSTAGDMGVAEAPVESARSDAVLGVPRGEPDAVAPAKTWFGRAGDGYKTIGDAQMALPSRQKVDADLSWRVEPMPNGKFRLAGYADEGAKSGDANLPDIARSPQPVSPAGREAADVAGVRPPAADVRGPDGDAVRPGQQVDGDHGAPAEAAAAVVPPVFESLGKTGGPGPAGGKTSRARSYDKNPFLTFLAEQGLFHVKGDNRSQKSEFSPDKNISVPGYHVALFRRDGKQPDVLVQPAIEAGYLPHGADEQQLVNLIRRAVGGERIAPLYAEGEAEKEMQAQLQAHIDQHEDLADLAPEDLAESRYAAADPELQARVRELIAKAEQGGIDHESILEDVAKKDQNASQDEYHAAASQALEAALAEQGSARAQDRSGPAGEKAPEPQGQAEGLTRPSREDILAQQESSQQGEREAAQRRTEEDKRASADAQRGEFGLTGSDRPADANPDQAPMFSRGVSSGREAEANSAKSGIRAWYDKFVSLLPQSYREDSYRREPLSAEDRDLHPAAEVRAQVEALNKELRGPDDRKGHGPIGIDELGNLSVDSRDIGTAAILEKIAPFADKLGYGLYVTGVPTGSVSMLRAADFHSELSLAAVADRLLKRTPQMPSSVYGVAARGTIMARKPRGFGMVMFQRADPLFKRASITATPGSMQARDVRKTLAPALAKLQLPHFIHQSTEDASKATGQAIPDDAKGFHWKGQIHLIADNIASRLEAQEVFWHEVQHAGLNESLDSGSKAYEDALRGLSLQNKNIRDAAKDWMERHGREDYANRIARGATPERAMYRTKLQAIDEALAELSGRKGEKINGIAKFIAKVQEFLRSLGLHDLAKWIEGKTDAQALSMILGAREAVMGEATGQGRGQLAPAFSKDRDNVPMASRKGVVGKDQGGRSADDNTRAPRPVRTDLPEHERFAIAFEDAGFKNVQVGGSAHSDSQYVSIHDEPSGARIEVRFADHAQSGRAMALHNVPDVEVGDFKGADAADLASAVRATIKKINAERADAGAPLIEDATGDAIAGRLSNESPAPNSDGASKTGDGSDSAMAAMLKKRAENPSFARAKTADEAPPKEEAKTPGTPAFQGARDMASGLVRDAFMQTAPMSLGTREARAAAQKFANDMRAARSQWQRMSEMIKMRFSKDERKEMWEAADEQNTLLQEGKDTAGKGLDRLNAKQRAAMQTLHQYGEELWKRAHDVGMVSGEGLPFWTPRVAVMIGEDGSFAKIGEPGKKAASAGVGRNVMTSAPSALHRKHVGTTESEAALKAKVGENAQYVRDVLTMPLAMSRFEQAIAGRELINTIKEIGLATGAETVNSTGGPGFFTLDHPAFTQFRPRMMTNAEGKTTPALDQNGEMVFDRTPMFISKDFEGPLKAVMSNKDGDIYSGYMLLKGKAMTSIMASPLTHNMVIYGRALAYSPFKVGSGYLYWKGHALAKDAGLMDKFIRAGMVPIGANKNSMMDITDVARGLGRQGSWGDPNESWISLSAKALGNALHEGLGDKAKAGLDAAGDFVHHTLLWKQVGAIQIGIANDARQHLLGKGFSDAAATQIAAHLSNRYAGAVAQENMSEIARKTANVLLFSRSFNMGNLGTMKDMFSGMPEGMKAKLMQDVGELEGKKALSYAKRKAVGTVIADVGIAVLATSLVQSAVNVLLKDKDPGDEAAGYLARLSEMFENVKDHPLDPSSYNPYRLSPTWLNEPDKHDRIDMGEQPGGRHEYMRLPTGKVVEDMIGWAFHPGDTFAKKMSPMAKAIAQDAMNDRGFGVPVMEPEAGFFKRIYDLASHVAEAQLPWDSIKNIYDLTRGKATDLDKDKLAGFATGFTFSQGYPQGPEGAVAAKVEERVHASRKYLMEQVKRDLKYGDEDAAREKLDAIGLTPKEINLIIRRVEEPKSGLSKSARQRFNRHSTDAEKLEMDRQR